MTQTKTKDGCSSVPLETLVGRLIEMHNNPPRKIGWMEQTTLREAAEMLTRLANDARPAGLYVGKVQYVRAGGNAGLAWYVAPDYESCEYGYQPNEGDMLYAVTPNIMSTAPIAQGPVDVNVSGADEPAYLTEVVTKTIFKYNPKYGDERVCKCGHSYYRHFDSYEDMEPIGCKYCECMWFEEDPTPP